MKPALLNNRYQVVRVLASGGFGETWLAEDSFLPSRRLCVIKQLKLLADNPKVRQLVHERFQREAAILEELGQASSQIPELYAYFEEGGRFYLVQEWIKGQTLAEKIRAEGTLSESIVLEILTGILPVLSYIHDRGIIHRDLKPDNIILRQADEKPVLIDFGAVKETVGTVLNSQGETVSSIVIGTPGYMPPEQAAGRPIFSSDLFSLGLTAIYLLTGKHPQTLQTDPRSGEFIWRIGTPAVSSAFADIIDRAIQYHPRDRFATAEDMLTALQRALPSLVPLTNQPVLATSTAILPTQSYSHASIPPTQAQSVALPPSVPPPVPPASLPASVPLPSIPPTQLHSTSSKPPFLRPAQWVGATAALLLLTGSYFYYQKQPDREAQAALEEIQMLHLQGEHQDCINRAQSFPDQSPERLERVESLLAECLSARDQQTLQAAVDIASQPDANLKEAIAEASKVPATSPVYSDAEHYIFKWQTTVLQNYLNDHSSTTISRLQPIVEQITKEEISISYDSSSNALFAQERGIRISTALFMEVLRGNGAEVRSEYTDFMRLVVYPRQGSQQGSLTADQWQTYVQDKTKAEKPSDQLEKELLNQVQLTDR
ncbi:MAG: hypothetical protein Kow00121_24330 [Elainellaceae cyanobacterium]